jgi:hypothetical protein
MQGLGFLGLYEGYAIYRRHKLGLNPRANAFAAQVYGEINQILFLKMQQEKILIRQTNPHREDLADAYYLFMRKRPSLPMSEYAKQLTQKEFIQNLIRGFKSYVQNHSFWRDSSFSQFQSDQINWIELEKILILSFLRGFQEEKKNKNTSLKLDTEVKNSTKKILSVLKRYHQQEKTSEDPRTQKMIQEFKHWTTLKGPHAILINSRESHDVMVQFLQSFVENVLNSNDLSTLSRDFFYAFERDIEQFYDKHYLLPTQRYEDYAAQSQRQVLLRDFFEPNPKNPIT